MDIMETNRQQTCPRCHYTRSPQEPVPEWQCPKCQIVYDKYVSPDASLTSGERPSPRIIREDHSPKQHGSPVLWLLLLCLGLLWVAYLGYDYLRWPDQDKITLFVSADCGRSCSQAEEFLQNRGVDYIVKNIDASDDHRERWKRAGGKNVPLAFFGEERIEGFNKTIYQIALTGFQDRMSQEINQAVILFSAPNCSGCQQTVALFNRYGIPFEEYDILEPENQEVYRELFARGTPLIFIGNIRLDGFNEKALKFALSQVDLL